MRRDVYIENDSGGFSVLAADAVDAIIEDGRSDDLQFVVGHKAMLLELYGDDSLPVRIVVDEPLTPDEQAQWLARASWRIDTDDGRLLVMGGFDPDVLSWWNDAGGGGDGRGIAMVTARPGRWRVDLYAHVGSMNGRAILSETEEKPGTAYRRSHPGRAFPLWLTHMLQFSGDEDPGFEAIWNDVKGNIASGSLAVDLEGADPVGFLVHLTPFDGEALEAPDGGWFERDTNARVPSIFPAGLPSDAADPNLTTFRDDLLGRKPPEPERPIADRVVEIIEVWSGDPLSAIDGAPIPIPPNEIYLLHWMAALLADSPPRFEILVEPKGEWTPPASTPDYAVVAKGRTMTALGPVHNSGGWHVWWTSRSVAALLDTLPDGSSIDVAMAPRLDYDPDLDPAIGRALYAGTVKEGAFEITHASPRVARETLASAIAFVRDVAVDERITVAPGAEREAFDRTYASYEGLMGPAVWNGDTVTLDDPDVRFLLMLATSVFRAKFRGQWSANIDDS